jgi:hypothetical protein
MIRRIEVAAAQALALGRTAEPFIGELKNLSRRYCKISRQRPNKIREEKEQDEKVRKK